jgi:hypothetical protein
MAYQEGDEIQERRWHVDEQRQIIVRGKVAFVGLGGDMVINWEDGESSHRHINDPGIEEIGPR